MRNSAPDHGVVVTRIVQNCCALVRSSGAVKLKFRVVPCRQSLAITSGQGLTSPAYGSSAPVKK